MAKCKTITCNNHTEAEDGFCMICEANAWETRFDEQDAVTNNKKLKTNGEQTKMTDERKQTEKQNWLTDEAEELKKNAPADYEKLPSLKLEENKIAEIEIDFAHPFQEWSGETKAGAPITKKIIPVTCKGEKMNFWLNVKNPIYRKIIELGNNGQTKFKIQQQGKQAETKYVLLED